MNHGRHPRTIICLLRRYWLIWCSGNKPWTRPLPGSTPAIWGWWADHLTSLGLFLQTAKSDFHDTAEFLWRLNEARGVGKYLRKYLWYFLIWQLFTLSGQCGNTNRLVFRRIPKLGMGTRVYVWVGKVNSYRNPAFLCPSLGVKWRTSIHFSHMKCSLNRIAVLSNKK